MNQYFITVLLSTASAVALAQGSPTLTASCPESKTRAEVAAEVMAARANGTLTLAGEASLPERGFASQRSRGEVMAEVARARANGSLQAAGEAEVPEHVFGSGRSRDAVVAELMAAIAHGTLQPAGDSASPDRFSTAHGLAADVRYCEASSARRRSST